MRLRDQIHSAGKAPDQIHSTDKAPGLCSKTTHAGETVRVPSPGAYLTDGLALFRVQNALTSKDEVLYELEDCFTFELLLCPAHTLAGLGLRTVDPDGTMIPIRVIFDRA